MITFNSLYRDSLQRLRLLHAHFRLSILFIEIPVFKKKDVIDRFKTFNSLYRDSHMRMYLNLSARAPFNSLYRDSEVLQEKCEGEDLNLSILFIEIHGSNDVLFVTSSSNFQFSLSRFKYGSETPSFGFF